MAESTIRECVVYARERLPRSEADLLVSTSLGVPRNHLYAFDECAVEALSVSRMKRTIARRQEGEPVAYILGERGFWSFDVEVTPQVLIPRPDTETLVAAALPLIAPEARVLDVGTGCGAVALAIASERPRAFVTATDIDPACIALCQRNAERLDLRVATLVADCFEGIGQRFDVIVSNPPYVDDRDPRLEEGDLRFEPRRALRGGPNGGLDIIARLVRAAPNHLARVGWLCLEHGSDQEAAVAGLFRAHGFRRIRCHRDIEGRPRVTTGCRRNGEP
ncbi:MAG: peptide chain release factor N(5)-glutamine methyltransferase [Gammaproteobacteria bacterium]|nr:peptide chain release factor N(5)-glutamine methyltransferase [Gammaproteobacteria bacterium]MYF27946.1 peptide chain release factor N(5)-glutamine methyltransferase [Gammaproteobacteria bacterium]MYK44945.1 peptide chain release factor N(5)-glutamine methyltransferase [Gammaproteobacteria bacterium]